MNYDFYFNKLQKVNVRKEEKKRKGREENAHSREQRTHRAARYCASTNYTKLKRDNVYSEPQFCVHIAIA